MAKFTPGTLLMQRARMACEAVAAGPFTPLVLKRYGPLIGGECGICLGYPSETVEGRGCLVWDHKPDAEKAVGASS